MSDPEVEETPAIKQMREQINKLTKSLQEATEFQTRAEQSERKLALLDAGLDLKSPMGRLFADAYKGDGTPEDVKAKMAEYGLVEAPKVDEPDEMDVFRRQSEASVPSGPAPAANAAYESDMANAKSIEDIIAVSAKHNRLNYEG